MGAEQLPILFSEFPMACHAEWKLMEYSLEIQRISLPHKLLSITYKQSKHKRIPHMHYKLYKLYKHKALQMN